MPDLDQDHSDLESTSDDEQVDNARRQTLKRIAFAASVAPAMVILLRGESSAQGNGNAKGKGKGPNCDNPGGHLGFNRNGHSAC